MREKWGLTILSQGAQILRANTEHPRRQWTERSVPFFRPATLIRVHRRSSAAKIVFAFPNKGLFTNSTIGAIARTLFAISVFNLGDFASDAGSSTHQYHCFILMRSAAGCSA